MERTEELGSMAIVSLIIILIGAYFASGSFFPSGWGRGTRICCAGIYVLFNLLYLAATNLKTLQRKEEEDESDYEDHYEDNYDEPTRL